jgi:hypothetical protein
MLFIATFAVFACFMLGLGLGSLLGRRRIRAACAAYGADLRCANETCRCFADRGDDERPAARS